MATTLNRQMTVEEYSALPKTESLRYELHNGELVKLTRPKFKHFSIQLRTRRLLEAVAGDAGIVEIEIPFRARAEYEVRAADVAYVSRARWDQCDPEDYLRGAPDLVIEVMSRSTKAEEIAEKEALCLQNGSREFWILYPKLREIKVSTPDGITTTYREGQEIPLRIFGSGTLKVDALFS